MREVRIYSWVQRFPLYLSKKTLILNVINVNTSLSVLLTTKITCSVYLYTGPRLTSPHSRSLRHTSTKLECSVHFYTRTGNTWSSQGPQWEQLRHTEQTFHVKTISTVTRSFCLCIKCLHPTWSTVSVQCVTVCPPHRSWLHQSSPHSRPCRHTSTPGSHTLHWHTERCMRRTLCQTQMVWLTENGQGH